MASLKALGGLERHEVITFLAAQRAFQAWCTIKKEFRDTLTS
jgi:hypothetical protein